MRWNPEAAIRKWRGRSDADWLVPRMGRGRNMILPISTLSHLGDHWCSPPKWPLHVVWPSRSGAAIDRGLRAEPLPGAEVHEGHRPAAGRAVDGRVPGAGHLPGRRLAQRPAAKACGAGLWGMWRGRCGLKRVKVALNFAMWGDPGRSEFGRQGPHIRSIVAGGLRAYNKDLQRPMARTGPE